MWPFLFLKTAMAALIASFCLFSGSLCRKLICCSTVILQMSMVVIIFEPIHSATVARWHDALVVDDARGEQPVSSAVY